MAPGLTVKSRLQVLFPTNQDNFYDQFNIVPDAFYEKLNGNVISLHNWHTLMPEEDAKNSVVKLGKESDEVFAKRILGHDLKNLIVINDEAHHAYRSGCGGRPARRIAACDLLDRGTCLRRCTSPRIPGRSSGLGRAARVGLSARTAEPELVHSAPGVAPQRVSAAMK